MGNCSSTKRPEESQAKLAIGEQCGEDVVLALDFLARAIGAKHEDLFKSPMKYPPLINLGMIACQCQRENRHTIPAVAGKTFTEMSQLMRAGRYARYASAAYLQTEEEIKQAIQGGDEDFEGNTEILHVEVAEPGFFIARDKASGDIVLSIRSKASVQETLTALVETEIVPFGEGKVSKALLEGSQEIIKKSKEPLEKAFKDSPKSQFAVVGHGWGGGLAIMATLQAFGEDSVVWPLLNNGRAKCWTFGAPPVFEPADKLPKERTDAICSFINGMDCVPKCCPLALGKLLQAMRKVDELELDLPHRVNFLRDKEEKFWGILPCNEQVPEDMEAQFPHLTAVGTGVFLYKGTNGQSYCERLTSEDVGTIPLEMGMFKDHAISSYIEHIVDVQNIVQRDKACGC